MIILCWTNKEDGLLRDHFTAFDKMADAKVAYHNLKHDANVWSASLCLPFESTETHYVKQVITMQSKIDHARILNAYLSRITAAQLEHILYAERRWVETSLNQGQVAQLNAQAGFYATVANAVDSMIAHDLFNVECVISEELTT